MSKEDRTVTGVKWELEPGDEPFADDFFLPETITLPEDVVSEAISGGSGVIENYLTEKYRFTCAGFDMSEWLKSQIEEDGPELG